MGKKAGKPKDTKDKGEEKKPPKGLTKLWNLYEKAGETLKRKNKTCPKCGPDTFMAAHKDRLTCGKCNYTEFLNKKE